MSSLRLRLLVWLIGPVLLINLAGAALAALLAWTPAQQAFDQGLNSAAATLLAHLERRDGKLTLQLPPAAERLLRSDAVDSIYYVVRGVDGELIAGDARFPPLQPGAGSAPVASYEARRDGEPVRVVALVAPAGGEVVQVGVARTLRKQAFIRANITRALLPLEILFTLAAVGVIWYCVRRALLPLDRLRGELDERGAGDLAPIGDAAVPDELAPLVSAFNALLGKVAAGAHAQHDFLADVAHQLRTPLAGLKLQLEWLAARHGDDAGSAQSLRLMLLSNERMIRQTNQLLALARAEPSRFERTRLGSLDLASLVEQSIQHFVDQAARKNIDLGFDLAPAAIDGDAFLLRDLIDNLIDNAVRYTPPEGTVTVRCRVEDGAGVLLVEDSGPGIAPDQREAVFERFVRLDEQTTGSGLGLAIVRDIALAHGARVSLGAHADGSGLVVKVTFQKR